MALPDPSLRSTALVTGASSGMGRAFARALAERGHGVTLVARRRDRLESLAAELRDAHGVAIHVVSADLSDPDARDEMAADIERQGLTVEILVNNAGFGIYSRFGDTPRGRELEQVRVDVEAVVDLCARYYPGMRDRGRGTIINMSSTAGLQPIPGNATYAASKSFVLLFSEGLHAEARDHAVTVTAVCPGPVRTEFQEANHAVFAERLPGMVWASAEDVAEESLRAAERGKRTIIPGGVATRAAFGPNRFAPKRLALAVGKRLMDTPS
ncbi:MAG TPA: SDR family oxidoreductase [Solirubrobacteraceae bacterium]|nr:SDR family oxidoreductase [Solirubrobacteraceae bacterium]